MIESRSYKDPSHGKLDAMVPLIARDYDRFELMAETLVQNFVDLGICWVVVPDREYKELRRLIAIPKFTLVTESELVPELATYRKLPFYGRRITGWYIQQLLKLAIAGHIRTDFYLVIDADVLCLRRVTRNDLIRNGRAIVKYTEENIHREWYENNSIEKLLGCPRPTRRVHGVTPALFSKEAVLALQAFLALRAQALLPKPLSLSLASPLRHVARLLSPGHGSDLLSSWRSLLLRKIPWTEYALYHWFLESRGQHFANSYHRYAGDQVLYGPGSVFTPEALPSWRIPPLTGDIYFVVANGNTGVPVSRVKSEIENTSWAAGAS